MRSTRVAIIAAAAVAAVVLFLVLRPDDGDERPEAAEPATTATTPTTTATAPTTTVPPTTTAPPTRTAPAPRRPSVVTIRITVRGGQPVGGIRRATVRRGRRVVFVVRSDVSDHVHLHGYDIFRDVAPGQPARLAFRASVAGRFEVELEDRGLQIADLQVRP